MRKKDIYGDGKLQASNVLSSIHVVAFNIASLTKQWIQILWYVNAVTGTW